MLCLPLAAIEKDILPFSKEEAEVFQPPITLLQSPVVFVFGQTMADYCVQLAP
jgi:hypothetical protein